MSSIYFHYLAIVSRVEKGVCPSFEHCTWISLIQECFVSSIFAIDPVVQKKMNMRKVYDDDNDDDWHGTHFDQKSLRDFGPCELKWQPT